MDKKHKDISRIDQPKKNHHGWYVRIRFEGKYHTKFFSDSKHGGSTQGLLKSIAWRNTTEVKLGKIRSDRYVTTRQNQTLEFRVFTTVTH